jgi:hypothetical protein
MRGGLATAVGAVVSSASPEEHVARTSIAVATENAEVVNVLEAFIA